jgi:hypothetical protein
MHPKSAKEIYSKKMVDSALESDDTQRLPAKPKRVRFVISDSEDQTEDPLLPTNQSGTEGDPFPYHCHCGAHGDGHSLSNDEPSVQCNICKNWSHVACQTDGRASNLRPKDPFHCDNCNASHKKPIFNRLADVCLFIYLFSPCLV